jgi:flavin reductase (DIM6/NTAB) family NADH-FMN oxidoreductase RutF
VTLQYELAPVSFEVFADAMAELASGVAVVTARHAGGQPCGLLVSSICSYSASPPSVLVAIGQERASYPAIADCHEFGVHLLGAEDGPTAEVFATRRDDKFAGLAWRWDGTVPRLGTASVFLACVRRAVLPHGDHAVVIGEVVRATLRAGEPLVYYRRRLGWRLV